MKIQLILLFLFVIGSISAQEEESWMLMDKGKTEKSTNRDTTKKQLDFNSGVRGKVNVKIDSRVNGLIKYNAEADNDGGKIWGYRVQIFFDKSKDNTDREKAKFKTRYGHGIECYVEYKAPNYRIKVGDFRTEIEAEHFKQDLLGVFPTAFVVKDKIRLPKLAKLNQENDEDPNN